MEREEVWERLQGRRPNNLLAEFLPFHFWLLLLFFFLFVLLLLLLLRLETNLLLLLPLQLQLLPLSLTNNNRKQTCIRAQDTPLQLANVTNTTNK